MSIRPLPLVASLLFAPAMHAGAQQLTHIEGLGSLSFPNSGAAEAQHDFIRGVLLLHSFEYGYAAEAFRKAQETDPDFGLAYWGEAMTYNHPVWNEKDPTAARAALARYAPTAAAREAKVPTDRERAFMRAVDVLYGDGVKEVLDTLYSREMARIAAAYPDDLEAQTFYALSLLGLSQGDRDVPTYIRAGAIALAAFAKNPDHPGAAHYTIHSFDDPVHAILAMPAARAYSHIAPDAAHAQHMTTHIFLALGMWDDVVEANVRADAVSDRNLAARNLPPTNCGHYNEWLMYGYQQQGRYRAARELLMGCFAQAHDTRLPANLRSAAANSYTYMRSLHLADTRAGDGPPVRSEIEADALPLVRRLAQAWGTGVAGLNRGDLATAERQYAFLNDNGGQVQEDYVSPYVPVWQATLKAMLLAKVDDEARALGSARDAAEYEAALPVDFGPPISFKPARELEAEILLAQGHAEEALAAFDLALARTPNRILSVLGAARAAAAAHRPDRATDAYRKLTELLAKADAGMPEVQEARAYLAAHTETTGGRR